MRSSSRTVTWLFVVSLAFSSLIFAQTATTSLRGTITDPNGAILQGATVTLANPATGYSRTTKSGNDGVYQFLEVPPATYTLTVTSPGFATLKQDRVTLHVSQPATLDFTMKVAAATEVVEVSGAAPMVNTTDASQGNVFDSTQLTSLPSEGLDPVSILSLQAGVTFLGNTNQDNTKPNQTEDSRAGAVAGARSDQTNVTVDGLDNNDQLQGYAFQGALKIPLDSIQEFRVTTSNSNADAGRSSGAQVNMVTKSGTNRFHGSLYEVNRSNLGQANDWFNEQAQVKEGLPNRPGPLVRNTFGAWVGGPIKKDRLFFFGGYEGQRTNEAIQTTHVVPSDNLRLGIVQYPCGSDPLCVDTPPGNNPNYSVSNGIASLTTAGLANIDQGCASASPPTCAWTAAGFPYDGGADPYVANVNSTNPNAIFAKYPPPNTDAVGDGLDYRGHTFAAPNPTKHDTYILKLDYKLTQSGNHNLFVKGHLQNWHSKSPPQFLLSPSGQPLPANDFLTNNNKGLSVGYTALFSSTLVNNLRYGLIRQGLGDTGLGVSDYNDFRGMAFVQGAGFTPSTLTNVPVHNLVDDVSWTKGKHTFQFGGNLRIISNNRTGNASNFSRAVTNVYWLDNAGIAGQGTILNPASLDPGSFAYPAVDPSFGTNYDFATAAVAGLLTETDKTYNQDKTGHFFGPGELITRNFRSHEGEFYFQDSWRATPNLVLTGGLRYSLLQPPYEMHGNQVSPSVSMNSWFKQRGQAMLQGQTINSQTPGGLVQMALSGQANGKAPYWAWDYKNLAPRLAFAYSPHADSGFLHTLFGSAGKSSIRGGYGIYFDHFGQGIVNSFDRNGSFGLTTTLTNPAGSQDVDCTPRLTDLFTLPPTNTIFCSQQVVGPPPPALPGLVTPPTGNSAGSFSIYWGLDDKLKTPYSHVVDFSITRELSRNFVLEASYIGRFAHRLLQEEDLAMPLDLVDPTSKMDYFTAATMLTKAANAGADVSQVATIPFWEHIYPQAAGMPTFGIFGSGCAPNAGGIPSSSFTATQAMYDLFSCYAGNETTALFYADLPQWFSVSGTDCVPACATLNGVTAPFAFFDDQFSSLYSWRSIGNSAYHSMQLSLRHAMTHGLQFDFNYTFSKSIDIGSNAERINEFEGSGFASSVINSWSPGQLRAVSDFDMRHQINFNWVYEFPLGRGRHFGGGMNKFLDAVVGGWGFSGIFHWTSGLPFTMPSGAGWSTNWQLQGAAVQTGSVPKIGVFRDSSGNPNMFQNPTEVGATAPNCPASGCVFRFPYPGESGQRNNLRGPGYFALDNGLYKKWKITEGQSLTFAWQTFNVTNTPRFDAAQAAFNFGLTFGNFGAYTNTLSTPRVMQFSARYEF
ncbi:MAG: carboxypeptidase-like regulatory domain-containing protein [Acidobacteriia bacterium]|nr:carboxypeptidase-like regulatory domain-containing protein [Terriglobia bacterium]